MSTDQNLTTVQKLTLFSFFLQNGVSLNENSYRADAPLAPAGHRYAENLKNFLLTLRESSAQSSPVSASAQDAPRQLTVWTSSRKRSFQTAAHFLDHEEIIVRQRSVLAERNPGVCDLMTAQEIQEKYPDECQRAKTDPYRHRFPRAEVRILFALNMIPMTLFCVVKLISAHLACHSPTMISQIALRKSSWSWREKRTMSSS